MSKLVFNREAHKQMWTWLAENPKKYKSDWPGWDYNGGTHAPVEAACFACEYTTKLTRVLEGDKHAQKECFYCPLIPECVPETCLGGLYLSWLGNLHAGKSEETAKYANKIANLPVREWD